MSEQCKHFDRYEMLIHLWASDAEVQKAVTDISDRYGRPMTAEFLGSSPWGAEYALVGSLISLAAYAEEHCYMEYEEFEQWDIKCLTCTPLVPNVVGATWAVAQ